MDLTWDFFATNQSSACLDISQLSNNTFARPYYLCKKKKKKNNDLSLFLSSSSLCMLFKDFFFLFQETPCLFTMYKP